LRRAIDLFLSFGMIFNMVFIKFIIPAVLNPGIGVPRGGKK
jgi:hypothetical protein